MSTKRIIRYTPTNSPHYSNAIICEQANLAGKDEIAQLRRQFQSMMWEQNEIAERKICELKREAAFREEKLHRKLADIHRSVESQRKDEGKRHKKKRCPHNSHHVMPVGSRRRTSQRRPSTGRNESKKWSHQVVGKFDVYVVQRSKDVKVDTPVRRLMQSTSRSVRFCGEETASKEGTKSRRRRRKETEL